MQKDGFIVRILLSDEGGKKELAPCGTCFPEGFERDVLFPCIGLYMQV
jgi:hypothetical protein